MQRTNGTRNEIGIELDAVTTCSMARCSELPIKNAVPLGLFVRWISSISAAARRTITSCRRTRRRLHVYRREQHMRARFRLPMVCVQLAQVYYLLFEKPQYCEHLTVRRNFVFGFK